MDAIAINDVRPDEATTMPRHLICTHMDMQRLLGLTAMLTAFFCWLLYALCN